MMSVEKGLIHIYCGDGKGKTTAAVGIALRCAGGGGRVLYTSFLKDNESGELNLLNKLEGVKVLKNPDTMKFYRSMNDDEKTMLQNFYSERFSSLMTELSNNYDIIILDEIIPTVNYGIVNENVLWDFILEKPEGTELIMTGRNPSERLLEKADYVTEMRKIKHPYDKGIMARKMIEM